MYTNTIIRVTLKEPTDGFWDGGKKQVFDFSISEYASPENVRVGSWGANFWFNVKRGKTVKLTLSYAVKRLKALCKKPIEKIEYIKD